MRITTGYLIVALTMAAAATGAAQQADFSGTWHLERDASELPQPRGFGGGRGGGRRFGGAGGGLPGGAADTLVIMQTADVLAVERQSDRGSSTVRYRLDGTASTNPGPRGVLTTTSRWEGTLILTEGSQQVSTPRGEFSIDLVERRSLSADGRTMTVESTRTTPRGDLAMTLVYTKGLP